ncbi:MAG: hypothetical protein M9953_09610 [Thermomicrobiales bacterium]|nr:hypothetical protein [Thermomicrobiales bacterium]MCO5217758.1 hypothetical protein [Thermomicrobiales bacterium]MCO5225583.1 hypothetical protein [Thermomicrobiales bacterium]MCO5228630.1 hypothetical protein [Thermomicrobiales bacterium]
MVFFRIMWRGMKDVYEQFAYFIMLSILFAFCTLPAAFVFLYVRFNLVTLPILMVSAIFMPPALVVLYALVDPRKYLDKPEMREVGQMYLRVFGRAWKLALCTVLPLIIIGWNIAYFSGSGHTLELLVPLWVVMWVFIFILTQYCFCLAGTLESGLRNSFRGGMFVMVKFPFRTVFLSLFVIGLGFAFTITMLPMIVIGPAFFAAIITRFVFDAFDIFVVDPNKPTDERAWERERGINPDRHVIARMFRREKN